ncbi:chymotrypsinogen 2-like isoform X1 [Daphnia pulicaria]|uniref:chymotrypsinogen 2-like isoform X1 n=1 Tax=Daphnia pulicaria TaxID=35523 RepID=UPI001EEC19F1|nr:chymotrypsinogen 2-like isoform X1 [Daphnia pulicaria]XP_046648390.1 chymotrypsinogen 2-like isoform X1 [Daphnia pulicaria]
MAQRIQSRPAILFLISSLLFFNSCPSSGNRVQKTTGYEWWAPEQSEASDSQMLRMVNSDVTKENEYPYMVAIIEYDPETESHTHFHCGGSLLSPTHVLTAAHCMFVNDTTQKMKTDQIQVLLGVHFFNQTTTDAQLRRKVRRIKTHEKYDPDNWYNNDIAILTLDSPVKFTETISPVCLPPQGSNDQYEGELAIVKGWGATGEDEGVSEVLLHSIKKIISNSQCQKIHAEAKITTRMMCAYRPGKDSCQGDSGGPMVIETNDLDENNTIDATNKPVGNRKKDCQWIQVGIVSWGDGCARKGIPGVYARVTSFLPWIKKEMMPMKSKLKYRINTIGRIRNN